MHNNLSAAAEIQGFPRAIRYDGNSTGIGFFSSWDNHTPELNDAVFKKEFDDVIEALRYDVL